MKNENQTSNLSLFIKGFAEHYVNGNAPWDTGKPKPPFIEIAEQVVGPVLDAGCGTGDTSIYLASRGLKVTAIDFVEEAILKAKSKTEGKNLPVEFFVTDATRLNEWNEKFNTVIDSGLLHCIYDKEKYIDGLKHVLNSGGKLYVYYFKDDASSPNEGISDTELGKFFSDGWEIESIKEGNSSEEVLSGWKMKFAVIRKK